MHIIIAKRGVENMDRQMTKKLNKQAIWFVILHTIFLLDLAVEFFSIH